MTHNGATDRPADGTRSRRTRGLLATPTTLRTFAAIYVALAMNGSSCGSPFLSARAVFKME